MLSLEKLLNPVQTEPGSPQDTPNSYSPSCPGSPTRDDSTNVIHTDTKKQRTTKDGAIFTKSSVRGTVKYPPYQDLDAKAVRQVQMHHVHPFGEIEEYPRHIPYNSEKKTFLEKTGRESFEVFQYEFKGPRDNKVYTVMWDYNIGLVRITPFFKCLHYSKTMPAKMLNLNPGLKEITHSITGGALAAQGYWMPFSCALEICATFCDEISGALIPIFGPTFPSRCASRHSPSFPRMVIDESIIAAGIADAKEFRALYSAASTIHASPTFSFATPPPRSVPGHDAGSYRSRRAGLKRTFTNGSLCNTGTDTDNDSKTSSSDRYFNSPFTPASATSSCVPKTATWTATNSNQIPSPSDTISTLEIPPPDGPRKNNHKAALSCGQNPLPNSIPRSTRTTARSSSKSKNELPGNGHKWTREVAAVDGANGEGDDGYDGEASASGSEKSNDQEEDEREAAPGEPELRAAWVLMQLCVRGREHNPPRPLDTLRGCGGRCVIDPEAPKTKRRRASSF